MLLIPTDTESALYEFRTTIENDEYLITIDYSQREDRYYMSLALGDGSVLVRYWKLVPGIPLGPRVADRRMPGGAFVVFTNSQDKSAPGFGELGEDRRCQLLYFSSDELPSINRFEAAEIEEEIPV